MFSFAGSGFIAWAGNGIPCRGGVSNGMVTAYGIRSVTYPSSNLNVDLFAAIFCRSCPAGRCGTVI